LSVTEARSFHAWPRIVGVSVLGSLLAWHSVAGELSPEQVIATTSKATAEAIAKRHRELEKDTGKLHALIGELLRPQFDFEGACRLILREHWTHASSEQRERFVAAFYHYLVASYANALLEFHYDTVTVLPPDEALAADETTTRVRTMMKLNDGSQYHVDYYMRHGLAGWRILDVIAEGVSYVRTYRTDFGAEIRTNGLDKLIERLEHTELRSSNKSG
jgi:phospholipid transport system substrate-binding protein